MQPCPGITLSGVAAIRFIERTGILLQPCQQLLRLPFHKGDDVPAEYGITCILCKRTSATSLSRISASRPLPDR